MDETTLVADPAAEPPPRRRMTFGDKVRFVLRGIGQTLITCGLVVLLFIVYEVWVTNWFSERENHRLIQRLEKEWALPNSGPGTIKVGDAIGILYIPRLGTDFHWAIVQGDTTPNQDQLAKGPAHYGDTAMPGKVGNFAIAGHRVGKGEPFLNLDHLKSGDAVIVATRDTWYVYRVLGKPAHKNPQNVTQDVPVKLGGQPSTVSLPGREIVGSDDGNVLYPVPDHPTADAAVPLMTMTTCHPKFTAENRMIVYAELDTAATVHANGDKMPDSIKALYTEGLS
jgi:sortase A